MINLIYKDLRAYQHIVLFQVFIVLAIMGFGLFFDKNANMTVLGMMMYPATFPLIFLVSDEKFFTLMSSFPLSRRKIVLAKYLLGFGTAFLLVSLAATGAWLSIRTGLTRGIDLEAILTLEGTVLLTTPILVFNALLYPIFFRFANLKGSIALLMVFIVLGVTMIVGLILFEHSLEAGTYTGYDVFPELMGRIADFISSTGRTSFITYMILADISALLCSLAVSTWVFSRRDLGSD